MKPDKLSDRANPEDLINPLDDLELFDQLDEAGKCAVAAVLLDTPEVGADNPISKELRRRGYGKPEGEA